MTNNTLFGFAVAALVMACGSPSNGDTTGAGSSDGLGPDASTGGQSAAVAETGGSVAAGETGGASSTCPAGSLGCPCYADQACFGADLWCTNNVCSNVSPTGTGGASSVVMTNPFATGGSAPALTSSPAGGNSATGGTGTSLQGTGGAASTGGQATMATGGHAGTGGGSSLAIPLECITGKTGAANEMCLCQGSACSLVAYTATNYTTAYCSFRPGDNLAPCQSAPWDCPLSGTDQSGYIFPVNHVVCFASICLLSPNSRDSVTSAGAEYFEGYAVMTIQTTGGNTSKCCDSTGNCNY